jgi:hypothetical protein
VLSFINILFVRIYLRFVCRLNFLFYACWSVYVCVCVLWIAHFCVGFFLGVCRFIGVDFFFICGCFVLLIFVLLCAMDFCLIFLAAFLFVRCFVDMSFCLV